MGEFSRHLGRGTSCAYCGEYKIGAEAKKVKYLNFDDWYPDEGLTLDPALPHEQQLVEYLKKHGPDPVDMVECPMCLEVADEEYAEIVCGELWECVTCEEVHTEEDDAESCCKYNRDYEERNRAYAERHRAQAIEEAKALLAQEGFQVGPKQVPYGGTVDEMDRILKGL